MLLYLSVKYHSRQSCSPRRLVHNNSYVRLGNLAEQAKT